MGRGCQVRAHRADVRYAPLPRKTFVGAARSLGSCISDQWKQRKTHHRAYRQTYCFKHKIFGLSKISLNMNYNTEIRSFVNANKNRAEQVSFETLKNSFGTEIGQKIAFNTIYVKRYFLCSLAITLIETLLSLGPKFLCYHLLK